jgi:hypothetical protein
MSDESLTFRLQETTSPPGEIALADLAAVGRHLQELATRVSRWVADIDRPGRSTAVVEQAAALRLTGLRTGSTVLEVARGPSGLLDFDVPFEESFDNRFWSMIVAIGADTPPPDAPQRVRESVVALIDALEHAAGRVEVTRTNGARIDFRPADRERDVWVAPGRVVSEDTITVSGTLEMIDLASLRFRLRDDVGNPIPLDGIADPMAARTLLGLRAEATGHPVHDSRGRLTAIAQAALARSLVPEAWLMRVNDDSWMTPIDGPDVDGGVDFEDNEWHSFLSAIKGG